MNLLTLIFGGLSLAWLGGLAVIGWAMWKEGQEDDEKIKSEPLNLDSEPMNAKKINRTEVRENDEQ
nr:MAG TPA: Protein of unknown function (DUF2852) [Caudoviricetes sp.]